MSYLVRHHPETVGSRVRRIKSVQILHRVSPEPEKQGLSECGSQHHWALVIRCLKGIPQMIEFKARTKRKQALSLEVDEMRLANLSFVLTTKCRRIRAQRSASSLNFVLDLLARVLRVARRMGSRRHLQALPHQLTRHRLADCLLAALPRGIPRA